MECAKLLVDTVVRLKSFRDYSEQLCQADLFHPWYIYKITSLRVAWSRADPDGQVSVLRKVGHRAPSKGGGTMMP